MKGWSVDEAAGILTAAGMRDFAINAGGDIRLHGGAMCGGRGEDQLVVVAPGEQAAQRHIAPRAR